MINISVCVWSLSPSSIFFFIHGFGCSTERAIREERGVCHPSSEWGEVNLERGIYSPHSSEESSGLIHLLASPPTSTTSYRKRNFEWRLKGVVFHVALRVTFYGEHCYVELWFMLNLLVNSEVEYDIPSSSHDFTSNAMLCQSCRMQWFHIFFSEAGDHCGIIVPGLCCTSWSWLMGSWVMASW